MHARRLKFEPLESRRLLAVIVDPISSISVDEGSTARVNASFIDSTPGGSYVNRVRWQSGAAEQPGGINSDPSGSNGALQVRYDYRYDTAGFFNAARRQVLEVGAEIVVGRLNDVLGGFTSTGGANQFTASFLHPGTGTMTTIPNFSVGANELIVFVGARDLADDSLASAGAGGGSGPLPFFDFAVSRGQTGVPTTDFAPWGGAISFDNQTTWHDSLSTAGLSGGENDLLSVVVHELGHVLGFTQGIESFNRWIANGRFTGPSATQAHDGSGAPPLSSDDSHWEDGLLDGGTEVSFDPNVTTGRRKLITELDFAALDDIGWELRARRINGQATDTNVYADNGSFSGRVSISNGGEMGTRNFQVMVRNVAPTLASMGTLTVRANTPLQFSASFTDPGTADTHQAVIAWGDGAAQQNLLVNQSTRIVSGQHAYTQPGTYQANVGIQDDDGGIATRRFAIVVTPPPRGDWQNPKNQFDVNNNSVTDPLDALLVINELSDRVFSDPVTGLLPPAPDDLVNFIDVTGDDTVAPQDAILVINQLSSSSSVARDEPSSIRAIRSAMALPERDPHSPSRSRSADEETNVLRTFADFSMSWLDS